MNNKYKVIKLFYVPVGRYVYLNVFIIFFGQKQINKNPKLTIKTNKICILF